MSRKSDINLAQLLNTFSPDAVLEEVKYNFVFNYPVEDFLKVRKAFSDVRKLFKGNFPGYRRCTTPYHNINHSCDVFLALSRIIDGYNIENSPIPAGKVIIALIASLLHDSGLIAKSSEKKSRGAEHMPDHVNRSAEFTRKHLENRGYSSEDVKMAGRIIQITDMEASVSDIKFKSDLEHTLACMLATADLIGQMAARTYLERLLHLYREFREAGIPDYNSEYDLLNKTEGFYKKVMLPKLEKAFQNVKRFTGVHFRRRYNIKKDLYTEAIEKNIKYLATTIKKSPHTYRQKLRRKEK